MSEDSAPDHTVKIVHDGVQNEHHPIPRDAERSEFPEERASAAQVAEAPAPPGPAEKTDDAIPDDRGLTTEPAASD
ncbi:MULTISPECIES: hypothetical protein [Arthrobacter]|uniref:Uncharacterized protein n=1 Tax=Arthrobacter terricola TaxID=2547396 RepID=A0A4R5KQI6_9MICC|nr:MULTISPECIES: hypothetical protein [Arthrobacter]MBT8160704.1 hypothetical protein [Arthrobacter sp. GN70]TDF97856.1 hypothetical protein E1809_07565 [Arthrobacter terricola]